MRTETIRESSIEFKRELKGVGGEESSRESSRKGEPHPLSLKQLYTVSTKGRSMRWS